MICTYTIFRYNTIIVDVQCDNLSAPANGEITSCSSGRVGVGYEGGTCSFTCNTGYELTGSNTRTCQSDGSWSGSDNVCIIKGKADVNMYVLIILCLLVAWLHASIQIFFHFSPNSIHYSKHWSQGQSINS